MAPHPVNVSTELELRWVVASTQSVSVRAGLAYDAVDPYAVQVQFHVGDGEATDNVQWTFARQLLADGVTRLTGQGDVQVWPASVLGEPVVCLSLTSPSGKALFEVPLPELADFLAMTYVAVPAGTESGHIDVDAELALLLWAQPET